MTSDDLANGTRALKCLDEQRNACPDPLGNRPDYLVRIDAQQRHALTLDDVLDTRRIDQAVLSPDGNWIATIVQRPARAGEVYGRLPYEIDPTRTDLWILDTRTGARSVVTNGFPDAAGFWCASWSPDNRHVALLSTQPAKGEPRGGDNVRLYVWDRITGAITRMGDAPVMSQTRYGGALDKLDLRGGAIKRGSAHACRPGEDNAPFLWLDSNRLLVVTLPQGQVSGVLDQYSRPFAEAARTAARLRVGIAHEKSDNWAETYITGRKVPPWRDAAGYAAVSPLSYVDRVNTPLLVIHGDLDMRGPASQAERFFYALYQQGKTAKLLRYGGESHSLAQSPANIRSIFAETNAWFGRYLMPAK